VTEAAELKVERRGSAGFLILNRIPALNALTLNMVREIAATLDGFERDPAVARVVVCGAGERAFCAGGDIRWLYERGRAGDYAAQSQFFREEYRLNARIKRFPKPYISLIDGIVMGGGVGVSLHGSRRVASEKAVFAMPEVGIGFFPDVGATYALPRVPHRIGAAMAATGLRADGADMAALGLATAYVESRKLPALAAALERPGDADALIGEFASRPPPSKLLAEAETIGQSFAQADAASVIAALERRDSEFSRRLREMMATKSPTSLAIALRQMQIGANLLFEDAMRVEFRIVTRICRGHDFYEGVRAAIVDKDNRPQWRPAAGENPAPSEIDAYFAPLGADELTLPGDAA
jgi:enoyl-CoA hydratase